MEDAVFLSWQRSFVRPSAPPIGGRTDGQTGVHVEAGRTTRPTKRGGASRSQRSSASMGCPDSTLLPHPAIFRM